MNMKRSFHPFTPCLIVALYSPVLVYVAPDGLPVALAACAWSGGSAHAGAGDPFCETCVANGGSGDNIYVTNCSVSTPSGQVCEMTGTVTFKNEGTCTARMETRCGGGDPCGTWDFSPSSDWRTVSRTTKCTAGQADLRVTLKARVELDCDCTVQSTGSHLSFDVLGDCPNV